MVQKMSPKFETKLWVHSPKSKFLDWQLRVSQFSHMGHHNNNNRIIVFDKHELIDHVIQGFSLSTASLVTISWLPSQYPSYICIMWPGPGSGDHQQLPGSPDQPSQRPRGGRAFSDRDLYPEVKIENNQILAGCDDNMTLWPVTCVARCWSWWITRFTPDWGVSRLLRLTPDSSWTASTSGQIQHRVSHKKCHFVWLQPFNKEAFLWDTVYRKTWKIINNVQIQFDQEAKSWV